MGFAENVFNVLQTVGIISFAISGAMVAIDKNADLFGVIVLALITAMGGGVMRDVLLGNVPPVFFTSFEYIVAAVISAAAVFMFACVFKGVYLKNETAIERINNIVDAVGLGLFSVVGAKVAIDAGFADNPFLVLSLALITATGGGIIRDLMMMEIPFVLNKRVYAVAAILGAFGYYVLFTLGVNDILCQVIGAFVTFAIRVLATAFKWNFPKVFDDCE